MTTVDEAVSIAFLRFAAVYGRRWDTPSTASRGWAELLETIGATADEIVAASVAWSVSRDWPPSLSELRGAIPRFCRCGKCNHCSRRARALATRLAAAGCHGSEPATGPVAIAETTGAVLGRLQGTQRARLGDGLTSDSKNSSASILGLPRAIGGQGGS